jgi:signal transduction histidine kinase
MIALQRVFLSFLLLSTLYGSDTISIDKLFGINSSAMLLIDPKSGDIIKANQKAQEFYNYPDLTKMKISDINAFTKEQIEDEMKRAHERNLNHFIFQHRLYGGEVIKVEVHSYPVVYQGKNLLFSIIHGTSKEISINNFNTRLEEQVALQTEELKQQQTKNQIMYFSIIVFLVIIVVVLFFLMRSKQRYYSQEKVIIKQEKRAMMGDMIESIAHQWRQPLSLISTSASGMQLKKQMDDLGDQEFKSFTDTILKSVDHLTATIDDFRDFYKTDKSKSVFFIDSVIEEGLSFYKSKFKNRDIQVIQDIESIEYKGYKGELLQVVMNILSNAKDQFETSEDEKLLFITLKKQSDQVIMSITDSAGGIPNNIVDKIFESHFTTKGDKDGTGIGLSMSKKIIEEHFDGKITASNTTFHFKNKEYKGAKFTVLLPIEPSSLSDDKISS